MSWIGLYETETARSGSRGSDLHDGCLANPDALLVNGTVMLEFSVSPDDRFPSRLLHFESADRWLRQFTVYLNADFSLSVICRQGPSQCYARVSIRRPENKALLRVSFIWNAPDRRGLLAVEDQSTGLIRQTRFSDPVPLPLIDAVSIMTPSEDNFIDGRIRCMAIADTEEPVGPSPAIAAGAMVETADGMRPIENLNIGDQVRTLDHGWQSVRWIVSGNLPACGTRAPVHLLAPYYGLEQDIVVAAGQHIMISGPDAEYHLGLDTVLVEAGLFTGHCGAIQPDSSRSATYYQILLDNHECIHLAGAWAGSLFIGGLAKYPDILQSTFLSRIPHSILPVHSRRTRPLLPDYQTPVLSDVLPA